MQKFKNKNTLILAFSAFLILVAVIIAIASLSGGKNKENKKVTGAPETSDVSASDEAVPLPPQTTEPAKAFSAATGKYKVATKDDPLGLRLEPNTNSDRLIYVPKGHEVNVIAVWEDWGYVVYNKTGGWLSMNYLEPVSSSKPATTAPASTASDAD